MRAVSLLSLIALTFLSALLWSDDAKPKAEPFPKVVNTQNPKDVPPTPEEAWKKITVPEGFNVSLFAGDPDVRQPIAMTLDDRGRLWVAECYTYTGGGRNTSWTDKQRDRIVIFEDADNDGRFDKRKVFTDNVRNLSGLTIGFGGVWALCSPNLIFIPDRNGDDVPDGPPQVKLEGWAVNGAGHNIVNGLTWGPEGWLYGRHGIMATSKVGLPGTSEKERTPLNCSIWRFHPTRKRFEVVTHGTTNPWGFDYDDHGEMFFTNNVIGHLWHVIPGAHFKRMYGEDFDPHLYELIDQHADHYHWDAGKSWTDSRSATGKHGELGGGHSHCGGMIYLGDSWPEKYRNTMFMCNTHGRRVNNDKLVRHGAGYAGKHAPDFLMANNPWFRGIDLKYGPDGGVYLSDWVDIGECHDHDGIHRTSGRVYKIVYGKPKPAQPINLSKLDNLELVKLQLHKNDWFVRHARRLLQERAAAGQDMKGVHEKLREMFATNKDVTRKLRALWALYVTGGIDQPFLRKQLEHPDDHVRVWAVRLLVDADKVDDDTITCLVERTQRDDSGLVRLYLASALQRLPIDQRAKIAAALLAHAADAKDHNLPLMLWYGVEPLIAAQPMHGVELTLQSKIPLVRRFGARRLTEEIKNRPEAVAALVKAIGSAGAADQLDVLKGMTDALHGWRKAPAPKTWELVQAKLGNSRNKEVQELVRNLSVVFGDGRALDELRAIALRSSADGEARRAALRVLIQNKPADLLPLLQKLVNDRATVAVAVEGLALFDDPKTPGKIISKYYSIGPDHRPAAINTLVTRTSYARALLEAVEQKKIPRADVTAFHARQIHSFNDAKLNALLSKVWGEIRSTSADKKKLIDRYHKLLSKKHLEGADLSNGRLLFNQACSACHRLYGEGKQVAPDLTGSNRDNLDYLLINIIDPNAVVAVDFKMSVVALKDGRLLNGVVLRKTDQTLSLQTQKEVVTVPAGDVDAINITPASLMPEGLLQTLKEEQVRDLVAYLMSKQQAPLPKK